MIDFVKRIFCKHDYMYVGGTNHINIDACVLSGIPRKEWTNYPEYTEHVYMCRKCGKKKKIKM